MARFAMSRALAKCLGSTSVPSVVSGPYGRRMRSALITRCGPVLLGVDRDALGVRALRSFCSAPNSGPSAPHGSREGSGKNTKEEHREEDQQGKPKDDVSDTSSSSSSSGRGESMTLLGMTGFGLSMVLRNPAAARVLRVAGPGGMVLGLVLSLYDLGGWKLIFAIPLAVAGYTGAGYAFDSMQEDSLKQRVVDELRETCPQLPRDFAEVLQSAHVSEFATNKLQLKTEWKVNGSDRPHWRIVVAAARPSRFQSWEVSSVETADGILEADLGGDGMPPAQTRNWDSTSAGPVKWRVVWQR